MKSDRRAAAYQLLDDHAATAALRRRLLRYAQRSLSDADAEDATQEALLALVCALDRYRGIAQIDTYSHAMLRHKVIDVYRTHRREFPCAPETLEALIDQATYTAPNLELAHDPADQMDARQQAEGFWATLRECLRQLPQRTRAMFELREVLELDLPLVCDHLAVTCNHGAVLAHRARTQVRRLWPSEQRF